MAQYLMRTATTVYLAQVLPLAVAVEKVVEMLATQAAAVAAVGKHWVVGRQIKHRLLVLQAMAMLAAVVRLEHIIQQGEAVALAELAELVQVQRVALAEAVERRR